MTNLERGATSASFKQIRVETVRDKVVSALKDAFFSGQLKPGDAIVERQLAQQMRVGTPAVREALVSLQEQGFVRRVANTATYVTKITYDEVRQLELLRVELEVLALQWAKPRVQPSDIDHLEKLVGKLVKAGERGNRRDFLERDLEFHGACWDLSGNKFLSETLRRLMTPLAVFVVLASGVNLDAAMARRHYDIVYALRDLEEPDFTEAIREIFTEIASRWISVMSDKPTG